MPGASPLVDDLDTVRQLEDAGAAAIVMHSLFEEQIAREQVAAARYLDAPQRILRRGAHATSPTRMRSSSGPDEYLEQLRKLQGGGVDPGDRLAQRHAPTAAGSTTPG